MPPPALKLDAFLPYRLVFTANLVSERIAGAYKALFDLTVAEWRLIAHAAEAEGGVTQQEVGRRSRMDKVTVSRAAIALVGRGLLARAPHDGDRRSHRLRLTAAGRRLYEAVAPEALALEARIFGPLDPAELARFVATLRRIDAAVLADEDQPSEPPTSQPSGSAAIAATSS